jgi:protein gp37
MGQNSAIEWTDHTFNPWTGCQAVSEACKFCYAEGLDKRFGHADRWGPHGVRVRTAAANWKRPLAWSLDAENAGQRVRVFCASMADVFDNAVPEEWRADLWALIRATPHLDWQLLTKRPQNIVKMLPADWGAGWPNVWLGTTVENQEEADRRIPHLLAVPARVRFLSCEPLLGPVDLNKNVPGERMLRWHRPMIGALDWVIAGGESGPGARPMDLAWTRSLRDQCAAARVPFFMKQMGGTLKARMPEIPADLMVREFPA